MTILEYLVTTLGIARLVAAPLACAASFGMLAIAYVRAGRWDQGWKARWERRHGTSLEILRKRTHQTLRATIAVRWAMLALVFMSIGSAYGPVVTALQRLVREPAITIGLSAIQILFALWFLALTAVGVSLLKFRLKRIDKLLSKMEGPDLV